MDLSGSTTLSNCNQSTENSTTDLSTSDNLFFLLFQHPVGTFTIILQQPCISFFSPLVDLYPPFTIFLLLIPHIFLSSLVVFDPPLTGHLHQNVPAPNSTTPYKFSAFHTSLASLTEPFHLNSLNNLTNHENN